MSDDIVSDVIAVAGVDGCPGGWIAVWREFGSDGSHGPAEFLTSARLEELVEALPQVSVFAIDMVMGLPERAENRQAEKAVRPLLGARQSSVFSIPSRNAVFCEDYREACAMALKTSEPPRKVSKQAFYLFPKIRELDGLLSSALEQRFFEVHPELAFWRFNDEAPMALPKKVKSRANPAGLDERRDLLVSKLGFDRAFLDQTPPKRAGRDDFLDAAINCAMAERIAKGHARPFPESFQRDARGLRMAIWA